MPVMIQPALEVPGGPVYFVSDAHLGSTHGVPEREHRLVDLFARARQEGATALFIVGDLFDFWFEYRHAIPKGTLRIARALLECVESGVDVVYLGGNHDFWVGEWLERELGVRTFADPIHARLQGRLVYVAHGDGLGPGDTGYKILRRVLRHRAAIAAYRLLHPDLGIPLASLASRASATKPKLPPEILVPRVVRDIVRPEFERGASAMIMGHLHYPVHLAEHGRDYLLLGDWIEEMTFARMDQGEFGLYRWNEGALKRIPPSPFPPNPPR